MSMTATVLQHSVTERTRTKNTKPVFKALDLSKSSVNIMNIARGTVSERRKWRHNKWQLWRTIFKVLAIVSAKADR
eukprot:1151245-Amphidinium_carterae.2